MPAPLTTRAPAKVNLNLIVHGRRRDGYHELSSLVMFAGVGDELSLDPARPAGLSIKGPFADGLEVDDGNLVLRAAANLACHLPGLRQGHFTLTKRLPVASGIGGGSADAAAALRLLARLNGLAPDHPALMDAARQTGADVPVCLVSRAVTMRGIGEVLGVPLDLPKLFAVLINPRIGVSTAQVFAALGLQPGELMRRSPDDLAKGGVSSWHEDGAEDADSFAAALGSGHGNDLEGPARRLVPEIEAVLQALSVAPGCRLARMSGSGATCFGLFDNCTRSAAAAKHIGGLYPQWWVKPTVLR